MCVAINLADPVVHFTEENFVDVIFTVGNIAVEKSASQKNVFYYYFLVEKEIRVISFFDENYFFSQINTFSSGEDV